MALVLEPAEREILPAGPVSELPLCNWIPPVDPTDAAPVETKTRPLSFSESPVCTEICPLASETISLLPVLMATTPDDTALPSPL